MVQLVVLPDVDGFMLRVSYWAICYFYHHSLDVAMNFKKYILDTNAFDFLLDEKVDLDKMQWCGQYFTTIVQESELTAVPAKKKDRREQLLKIYYTLPQEKILFDLTILDDIIMLDDDQTLVDQPSTFATDYTTSFANKPWRDAMVVEIAKNNDLIIVTNDVGMTTKAQGCDLKVISPLNLLSI